MTRTANHEETPAMTDVHPEYEALIEAGRALPVERVKNDNGSIDWVTALPAPYVVPGTYEPQPAVAVTRWYNQQERSWVVVWTSAEGYQIGTSTYVARLWEAQAEVARLYQQATATPDEALDAWAGGVTAMDPIEACEVCRQVEHDLDAHVAAVKDDLAQHVAAGLVPADVTSFSALHDHIDANVLRGLADTLSDDASFHRVVDEVAAWITSGGLTPPAQVRAEAEAWQDGAEASLMGDAPETDPSDLVEGTPVRWDEVRGEWVAIAPSCPIGHPDSVGCGCADGLIAADEERADEERADRVTRDGDDRSPLLDAMFAENPYRAQNVARLIEGVRRDAPTVLQAGVATLAVRGIVGVANRWTGELDPEWAILVEVFGEPTPEDWGMAQRTYGPTAGLPGLEPEVEVRAAPAAPTAAEDESYGRLLEQENAAYEASIGLHAGEDQDVVTQAGPGFVMFKGEAEPHGFVVDRVVAHGPWDSERATAVSIETTYEDGTEVGFELTDGEVVDLIARLSAILAERERQRDPGPNPENVSDEPAPTGRRAYVVQAVDRPTFYLAADVQGIVSLAHARRIARDVLGVEALDAITVSETSL